MKENSEGTGAGKVRGAQGIPAVRPAADGSFAVGAVLFSLECDNSPPRHAERDLHIVFSAFRLERQGGAMEQKP